MLSSNTAQQVLEMAVGLDLQGRVAALALDKVRGILRGAPVAADVIIVSRTGGIIGRAA